MEQKSKFQVGLTLIVLVLIVIGGLWLVSNISDNARTSKINTINNNQSAYAKGVIVKMSSYKGRALVVQYKIGHTDYSHGGGWDHNPKHLGEGDSINFRYSVLTPQLIITEMEEGY